MSKRKQRKNGSEDTKWTVNDVRAIVHNPIYAGLGPFPPLVDESTWVGAQKQSIREDGLEAVLRQVRAALMETFGAVPDFMDRPGWVDAAKKTVAQQGVEAYLKYLLGRLRVAYRNVTADSLVSQTNSYEVDVYVTSDAGQFGRPVACEVEAVNRQEAADLAEQSCQAEFPAGPVQVYRVSRGISDEEVDAKVQALKAAEAEGWLTLPETIDRDNLALDIIEAQDKLRDPWHGDEVNEADEELATLLDDDWDEVDDEDDEVD